MSFNSGKLIQDRYLMSCLPNLAACFKTGHTRGMRHSFAINCAPPQFCTNRDDNIVQSL